MKGPIAYLLSLFVGILFGCSSDSEREDVSNETAMEAGEFYFPPKNSDDWDQLNLQDFGWNVNAEQPLYDFLEAHKTDAFLILKDGKIVLENYFGDFTKDKNHAWNSAGKALTALTVGIAQEEGFLSLNDSSQGYLGEGWSSLSPDEEQQISVFNHLIMTTGLDYTVIDTFCTETQCLIYKNEPNTFWFYHNAPYTLLDGIVTAAVGQDFEDYFRDKIRDKIGMQGFWLSLGYNNVYFSTARSMARFGLLTLNKGAWEAEVLLSDTSYFDAMTHTSQDVNPAYGYLWWLNGKDKFRVPGSEIQFEGELIPNAPEDLIAALGKNDQKLYVVPSQNLVIVRMGGDAGETLLGPSSFDNELWEKINDLTN